MHAEEENLTLARLPLRHDTIQENPLESPDEVPLAEVIDLTLSSPSPNIIDLTVPTPPEDADSPPSSRHSTPDLSAGEMIALLEKAIALIRFLNQHVRQF